MTRAVIAAAALAVALSSCRYSRDAPEEVDRGDPPAASAGPSTNTTLLAPPVPWSPTAGEPLPQLKLAAASFVQTVGSYEPSADPVAAATSRLAALGGVDPALASKATALLRPDVRASVDVVYPQFGGLTADRASVMVVTHQRLITPDGSSASETRTIDIRLAKRGTDWVVEDIGDTGGSPVSRPDALTPAAARVVDHPRIELPDSARWDIFSGRIAEPVLLVLAGLADGHDIKVAVLSAGHPPQVFATERTSNHIPGRAVDIWYVDGPVVDQRSAGSPLQAVVQSLLGQGVTELGSPFDLDGPGRASFTNTVHTDHFHIGFDA